LKIFLLCIKIPLKGTLIEQHLIEQNITKDKQLNDLTYAASHSDQTSTSDSLMQAIRRSLAFSVAVYGMLKTPSKRLPDKGGKQYIILGAGMHTFV
jgi:hypothetical protein